MTPTRDIENQVAYAMEKGEEKGIEKGMDEGMKKGEEKNNRDVARKLKGMGVSMDIITAATGLSKEVVASL
ncbi:MAG: hypothetical protein IKH11_01840 [Bacteroidales bacterium]|nr:hypothetical protein [Bacteroidales bacterium]